MDPRFCLGGSSYLKYQRKHNNNDGFAHGGRSDHAVGHHIGFFSRRFSNGIFLPIRKVARFAESGPASGAVFHQGDTAHKEGTGKNLL